MSEHFTLFSDEPSSAFIAALEAAGITVRGWEIPPYRFSKRKTFKNSLKVEGRGWTNPRDKSGDLMLTVEHDRWRAFDVVLEIAEVHGLYVANGGMTDG